ncbi:MAG: hypothetical protein HN737_12185 [Desulfobacterales bacterium]|jgi:hypothetical protein|nr:hypothetical protein [Desulfobacteraceae bacterium]MBT4364573.1 hypothetical protein [Desulfobacteraceae bacterium]MBT7085721.1 hypothetical protein [Desulfobacterales bacterium]MBT7698156.1 hypothetical protein [Desulfobacterales bacterium]
MQRYKKGILICLVCIISFLPAVSMALDVDVQGHLQSQATLRDTTGVQYGFYDGNTEFVALRNDLKLNIYLRPEYQIEPALRFEKAFLCYRGVYNAIFDLTDRYDRIVVDADTSNFETGRDELRFENDLREATLDFIYEAPTNTTYKLRLGRQIVPWGETLSFTITSVLNPLDMTNSASFTLPEDTRLPLWMARFDISKNSVGIFDTLNLQLIAIPEITPMLFPIGNDNDPNTDFWAAPYGGGFAAMSSAFGATGIEQVVPSSGTENMEFAARVSFDISSFHMELYFYDGYQDMMAMDFSEIFTATGSTIYWRHPDQQMGGFSGNYYFEPLEAVITFEGSYTDTNTFMDLGPLGMANGMRGYETYGVWQGLVGYSSAIQFIPDHIKGTKSALNGSYEAYVRRIAGYDEATSGNAAEEDYYRFTASLSTDYDHGSVPVSIFVMYEPVGVLYTSIGISKIMGPWYFKLAQSAVFGNKTAAAGAFSTLIGSSELTFTAGYNF